MTPYSGHFGEISSFNPRTYYTQQLRGSSHYPIYQSGRGLGSRLFKIAKTIGTPLLKDIIIPTVKQEVGQVLQDIASGVGVKSALKRGAKRAGKSLARKATNRIMNGKGRKRKRKQNPNTALSALLKGINSAKRRKRY